jgi:hypothetical protein
LQILSFQFNLSMSKKTQTACQGLAKIEDGNRLEDKIEA